MMFFMFILIAFVMAVGVPGMIVLFEDGIPKGLLNPGAHLARRKLNKVKRRELETKKRIDKAEADFKKSILNYKEAVDFKRKTRTTLEVGWIEQYREIVPLSIETALTDEELEEAKQQKAIAAKAKRQAMKDTVTPARFKTGYEDGKIIDDRHDYGLLHYNYETGRTYYK